MTLVGVRTALVEPAWLADVEVRSFKNGACGTFSFANAPYAQRLWSGPYDGPTKLTWTVMDGLGNTTRAVRTVTVDNTKPRVAFAKAPRNKAKVKVTVTVTATAGDRNGVSRVELLVNGKVVAKDAAGPYRFSVQAKKYGKKITVRLRAFDRAGNASYTPTRTRRR